MPRKSSQPSLLGMFMPEQVRSPRRKRPLAFPRTSEMRHFPPQRGVIWGMSDKMRTLFWFTIIALVAIGLFYDGRELAYLAKNASTVVSKGGLWPYILFGTSSHGLIRNSDIFSFLQVIRLPIFLVSCSLFLLWGFGVRGAPLPALLRSRFLFVRIFLAPLLIAPSVLPIYLVMHAGAFSYTGQSSGIWSVSNFIHYFAAGDFQVLFQTTDMLIDNALDEVWHALSELDFLGAAFNFFLWLFMQFWNQNHVSNALPHSFNMGIAYARLIWDIYGFTMLGWFGWMSLRSALTSEEVEAI
jgi:hypothetical protein